MLSSVAGVPQCKIALEKLDDYNKKVGGVRWEEHYLNNSYNS